MEIERELKAQQQAREAAAAAALAVNNAGQLSLFRDSSGDGGSGENNNGTGSTPGNVSSTGILIKGSTSYFSVLIFW